MAYRNAVARAQELGLALPYSSSAVEGLTVHSLGQVRPGPRCRERGHLGLCCAAHSPDRPAQGAWQPPPLTRPASLPPQVKPQWPGFSSSVQLWPLGYHASWRAPYGGSTFHCRIQGDAAGPKFVVSLEVRRRQGFGAGGGGVEGRCGLAPARAPWGPGAG